MQCASNVTEENEDRIGESPPNMTGIMHRLGQSLKEISLRNAAIIATAMFLISGSSWYFLEEDPVSNAIFSDISSSFINGLGALCLLYAARISRNYDKKLYYGWLFIFISLFSFFLGVVIFSYYYRYINIE